MTIRGKIASMLEENGLWPKESVEKVMAEVIGDPNNESMSTRWDDDEEGYPPFLMLALWGIAKKHALDYIDRECPEAWFREMFT